jgi:peroxiredoxin
VAIAPQIREKNLEVKNQHRLAYPVLGDSGHAYLRGLGLVFAFPDDLRELYLSFGIDLAAFNGDDSWELPLSTRIIIDRDGVIRAIDADPDYTHRPEPDATLEVLRSL